MPEGQVTVQAQGGDLLLAASQKPRSEWDHSEHAI